MDAYDNLSNLTISSTNPCLIVYMLDQSGSMKEGFGNARHSKAEELAKAININLYELGLRCIGSNEEIKNRFEIAIIGYGKDPHLVQSAWEGNLKGKWVVPIENVFENPIGQIDDYPIWVNPYAMESTPMTQAFQNVKEICKDWINWGNHSECHPPIVINITDGDATDSDNNFNSLKREVENIKKLSTNYGSVSIFNIHISGRTGDRILFPSEQNSNDRSSRLLFELSSQLNENMIRMAQIKGYNVDDNAKGYVFNGNGSDLINFLIIGTPQ